MARNCSTCGRANDDDALYCMGCGAPLAATPPVGTAPETAFVAVDAAAPATPASAQTPAPEAPIAPSGPPVPPPPGPTVAPGAPGGSGKGAPMWLVVVLVVAVIAIAAVAALFFFTSGNGGGEDESPAPVASTPAPPTPEAALNRFLAAAVGPKSNQLAAVMADGAVEPITKFAGRQIFQIAYSPDGKWLACIAGTFKRSELWLFDTTTGEARQATVKTPNVLAVDSMAWLSAGELLVAAYTVPPKSTGENADFLVYDPNADGFTALLDSGGVALRGVSVSASRDGATVAFVTYTDVKTDQYGMVTASERLQVLDRGSGTVTELGRNKAMFDVNARAFDDPLISPNGSALIYRRAGSDVGTSYTVIDSSGGTLMAPKETQMPAGYAWDPDGTKVVFTGHSLQTAQNETGIGPAIFWLFDTELGGKPVVIAKYDDTMVQDLSWSADGETIAWAEYDQKQYETGTVYLMSARGGDSKLLVKQALTPVWAPGAATSLQTSPSPEQ
jgi:Tol biopolymer transport system component